ncbi:MtaA/CmuA family methyltransferase [Desulfospira joergensenii]|uniref:MtaA/CmuA family methyltransferase n=1 Tax=Desulfospira joergensenii TaxID=53329 RepID=UPI000486757A|nr:MtaA/CmuA family methyltransferase [Desulfospira joergensenii]
MNLKERFMNRLEGKSVDMTPVGCTTTYGLVDLMKKCGAERPLADTDPQAMATLAMSAEIAGFEMVKAMGWDITPMSEAFGCGLGVPQIDLQYCIKEHPYTDSLDKLEYPSDFLDRGRFPAYKKQFEILKKEVGDKMVIFGESEGAFTCGANLVGTEAFMKWMFKRKADVEKILEVTKLAMIDVINFAFENGADYYVMAEPTAGPALMSPKLFKKFVVPVLSEIVDKTNGPLVLHICGNTDLIIPLMCETGVKGLSIEEGANMKEAANVAHQNGVRVFGNVATATTLFMGTPEDAYKEAWAALENGTDFLCPGCGIAPGSPLENVLQLKKARDDFFK